MDSRSKLSLTLLTLVLAAWTGYRLGHSELSPGHGATAESPKAVEPAPEGWSVHQDPMGFAVNVPRQWTVRGDRSSGRVEVEGPADEQIILWPVFSPSAGEARGGFQSVAAAVFGKLAAKVWPGARWEAPEAVSQTAMVWRGRLGGRIAVAALTWVPSPRGAAACLYGVSAPEARYRSVEQTAARILGSFRVTGAPASPKTAAPAVSYVRWTDPRENAFSLDVPAQWRVSGGLYRFASTDVRADVEAISPDQRIRITSGDSGIPPFAVPNQMLLMAGFGEGSWYSPGYGVRMMVRRYVSGTAFAQEYVENAAADGCAALRFTSARDRPDAVEAINRVNAQLGGYGVGVRLSAGEVSFTCAKNGQRMEGYYFAATQLVQTPAVAQWSVPHIYGFLATPECAALSRSVLGRMIQSFRINPQWAAMQQNITANTSRIVARTNQEITRLITEGYEARQASDDEIARRRSNAILGREDVIDPATGEQFKIESGSNYYWVDNLGNIVGTETHTLPDIDFREMIRLP